MSTVLSLGNWLLPLIYLALVIDYGATFFLRVRAQQRNPWVLPAVAVHSLFLAARGLWLGRLPLEFTAELLSMIALSCAAVYWLMERLSRDRRAGMFVFLVIFLLQYASSLLLAGGQAGPAHEAAARRGWDRVHAIPAILAYTALVFAAVYGVLHLTGGRLLRRHRFGLLFDRLPALELLGKLSWYSLLSGFVFMTASIATGVVTFKHMQAGGQASSLELKVAMKIVTGSAAWLICAIAVGGKYLAKWSYARTSLVAVGGFLMVALLFVSSILFS